MFCNAAYVRFVNQRFFLRDFRFISVRSIVLYDISLRRIFAGVKVTARHIFINLFPCAVHSAVLNTSKCIFI